MRWRDPFTTISPHVSEHGTGACAQATLDDLGKGLGPALIAALISQMPRTAAFNVAIAGWLPCGLMFMMAGFTIAKDEATVQRRLASIATRAAPSEHGFLATSTLEGIATPALSHFTEDSLTPTGMRGAIELGAISGNQANAETMPGVREEFGLSEAEDVPLLGAGR